MDHPTQSYLFTLTNSGLFLGLIPRPSPFFGLFCGHLRRHFRLHSATMTELAAWNLAACRHNGRQAWSPWHHNGRQIWPKACSMTPHCLCGDLCIVLVKDCTPERRTVRLEYTLIYSNMQEYILNNHPIILAYSVNNRQVFRKQVCLFWFGTVPE